MGILYSRGTIVMKCFRQIGVSLTMDRKSRLALETTVADLREVTQKIRDILPTAEGPVRDNLVEMQAETQTAIQYYSGVLARSPRANVPPIAGRVALAAFGACGVGLVPPQFVEPTR